jgi:hypothetical protein
MSTPTALQKVQEVVNQLNAALLQKDQLTEQLNITNEKVKAFRNLLAGIELGRQAAVESAGADQPDPPMDKAE